MNACLLKLPLILLILISTTSCVQPTYSKEKVEQSVIELCKDEYGLDVNAKIIGSTLGVFIPVEGLIDSELRLDKDAAEKIEDVALSIHRVVMSTDKPLKFYTLTARDTKTAGAEFVLTGFIYDVVRVRLLDISRGEYYKRILRDFKFNSVVAGEAKIRELFDALNKHSSSTHDIRALFYPSYTIGKKDSQKIEIVQMEAKEISDMEALIYIKTKEYYEPRQGFEVYKAIFPTGFNNDYLILVNLSMFPNPIKEIVSKYFYSATEIRQRNLKETFDQYQDLGYIGADGLPKKDLQTDWFLSQQIVRRIKMLFEEDKRYGKRFSVQNVQGSSNNNIFTFKFSIASETPSDKDNEIIFSKILRLAAAVLHSYEFEDFVGLELIDTAPEGKSIYLSKQDLERFRRKRIKFKEQNEGSLEILR